MKKLIPCETMQVLVFCLCCSTLLAGEEAPNLIKNSSFEIATNTAASEYMGVPDFWTVSWQNMNYPWNVMRGAGVFRGATFGVDASTAFHGKQSLKVCIPAVNNAEIVYVVVGDDISDLNPDSPYVYTVYAKSDIDGMHLSYHGEIKKLTTSWARYAFRVTKGSTVFSPTFQASSKDAPPGGAAIWLDAVQLEQGETPGPYRSSPFDIIAKVEKKSSPPDPTLARRLQTPSLIIPMINEKPLLNGQLDGPGWEKAASVRDFILFDGSAMPKEQTSGRVFCNDDTLYIGLQCRESDIKNIVAKELGNNINVTSDDDVEVFLDVKGTHKEYYHFAVNSLGKRYSAKAHDSSWSCNWSAKTTVTNDLWTAEIAIPMNEIGLAKNNISFGVNFCRSNPRQKEFSCWSSTLSGFHNPRRFGKASFAGGESEAGDAAAAAAISQEANSGFRGDATLLVNGKKVFPLGVYNVNDINDFKDVKSHGFNAVILPDDIYWAFGGEYNAQPDLKAIGSYLDVAQENGIGVFVSLRLAYFKGYNKLRANSDDIKEQMDAIGRIIEKYRNHPALAGWYIADEPEGKEWLERVNRVYRLVKKMDPNKCAWLVNAQPESVTDFIGCNDVVAVDPYPVGRFPINMVSEWAQAARELVEDKKPLWIVLQAFSGGGWPREPTPDEMTCMAYLALTKQAKGLWQFSYKTAYVGLWNRIGVVNREVETLTPVLLAPDLEKKEDFVSIDGENEAVQMLQKVYNGKLYVLCVNSMDAPMTINFTLHGNRKGDEKIEVMFENRTINTANQIFKDVFNQYERHVYVIPLE